MGDDPEQSQHGAGVDRPASAATSLRMSRRATLLVASLVRCGRASTRRSTGPTAEMTLGNALQQAGRAREAGTDMLVKAVAAYQARSCEYHARTSAARLGLVAAKSRAAVALPRSANGKAAPMHWPNRRPHFARRSRSIWPRRHRRSSARLVRPRQHAVQLGRPRPGCGNPQAGRRRL